MTLILKQIFALVKLLNSETGTNQIAAGVSCGFILGMTPGFSLQSLLVFAIALVFRVQLGAAFIVAFFFSFVAYLLDPVFHQVGELILTAPQLQDLFTTLYNLPIVPFTRFNNTIFMGSAVIGFACFPFVFIISRMLIVRYRVQVLERFKTTKIWKAVKATSFYKWYYKYDQLYGR